MELERDGVADLDLGSVAKDGTGDVGRNGVAAFEDFQRAALFELQGETSEALAFGAEQAFGADAEIGGAALEAKAKRGNLHAKIKRDDAHVSGVEAFERLLEALSKAKSQARGHFIGALALLAEQIERAAKTGARGEFVYAAAENQDAIAYLLGESAAQVGDVLVEFAARLHYEFGGSGRR